MADSSRRAVTKRPTASRELFASPWMRLREDTVERPDGSTTEEHAFMVQLG